MGPIGFPELILIFVVALIVFGPRRLPEIGRTLGKALGEFRKATDELKNTLDREVRADDFKQVTAPTVSRSEPELLPEPTPAPPTPPHETTPEPPTV